jgi:3-oxoacyl-[acyl-carrier-protein] synthase II
MVKHRDVVITGLGLISPIGLNVGELIPSLLSGRSGVHLWESARLTKKYPAGMVLRNFDAEFSKLELPYLDRCTQMALLAAREAIADAGLSDFSTFAQRAGLYYGSVRGSADLEEVWFDKYLVGGAQSARPYTVFAIMHNAGAAQISVRHQVLGPVMTHNTACTSSGTAIGDAYRAIRDGYLDIAIAGGADAPLTTSTFVAWDGSRALAVPDVEDVGRSCQPFSKSRSGLVLGEGAAFIVLESAEHARKRGAHCYAALSGYGIASDGYHIGSPKAEGQVAAMLAALADAHIRPDEVGYFNAHATATKGGDVVEANAIQLAFGEAAKTMPVSSTKSVHGHLLGSTSALELIITVVAMTESFLPATTNLDEVDPECGLNHVANVPILDRPIEHAMSFSSGLGGTNVALVVSKSDELPSRRHAGSRSAS